ncbi:MAG TPA: hypothetical protein DIV79_14215 [Opitutae bacterium]|nr:hypothetical protein [Opitutaceae bacterium]HCR31163.1 hypothetical protein [Opitutae bacterium]|tara:strand:- start:378 stop:1241 length:864 start_codon:yes stop_codon:yes gene_type:complete
MTAAAMTENEKLALFSLMDDPSPFVRKELLNTLGQMGKEGLDLLQEAINGPNRILRWHAAKILSNLQSSNPAQEFRTFIQEMNYEMESGWLMISRVAYPNLDVGEICQRLDAIATRCRELQIKPTTAREQCLVINRVLFHEMGFRGNAERYTDPDNSFINCVLETKRGLPITLSVLYLLIGQRLGTPIEPISAPGHFVIGCFDEQAPFYIDPFERGKFLTAGQMLKRIEESTLAPSIGHLAPASTHETLARICRNLSRHYSDNRDLSMANLFQSFLKEFKEAYEKQV